MELGTFLNMSKTVSGSFYTVSILHSSLNLNLKRILHATTPPVPIVWTSFLRIASSCVSSTKFYYYTVLRRSDTGHAGHLNLSSHWLTYLPNWHNDNNVYCKHTPQRLQFASVSPIQSATIHRQSCVITAPNSVQIYKLSLSLHLPSRYLRTNFFNKRITVADVLIF